MKKTLIRLAFTTVLGAMLVQGSPVAAKTPNDQLVIGTSLAQVLSLDPHQATEAKANEIMANL
ncbi:ABC transporter substrate-binding protein, partial [Agrobacterium sp. S2]|nr:ABC transporter substrate-binding protein [Agrobacterium sp. S2]